ncbi:hypothetical protein Tco_0828755, partial [Tanacetum coccineum]
MANVVTDALSRKERVKPRRIRAMAMTIQYGVRGSHSNVKPRKFLRSGSHSNVGYKKGCQSSKFDSNLSQITSMTVSRHEWIVSSERDRLIAVDC